MSTRAFPPLVLLLLGASSLPLGLSRGARRVPATGALSAQACESCHADEVRAWKGSRHAASATNLAFVVAMESAEQPWWCLNCHTPVGSDEGVTCAVCHQRDGLIITATPPPSDAEAAHPMRVEEDLLSPLFCSGCHELRAPDIHGNLERGGRMQSTFTEWLDTDRERDCVDCHLDGHRFTGRELMEEVVEARLDEGQLVVSLIGPVGHAVPTGDPFRRLELRACADPLCEQVLGTQTLTRLHRFDGTTWWEDGDNRLGPEGSGLPQQRRWRPPRGTLRWELNYRLVSPMDEPRLPIEDSVILLASGPMEPG